MMPWGHVMQVARVKGKSTGWISFFFDLCLEQADHTLAGVKLVNNVQSPLPIIEADAYRCTQLMYNLVTNAMKRLGLLVLSRIQSRAPHLRQQVQA